MRVARSYFVQEKPSTFICAASAPCGALSEVHLPVHAVSPIRASLQVYLAQTGKHSNNLTSVAEGDTLSRPKMICQPRPLALFGLDGLGLRELMAMQTKLGPVEWLVSCSCMRGNTEGIKENENVWHFVRNVLDLTLLRLAGP